MTAAYLLVVADDDTARELSGYVRQALLLQQEYLRRRGYPIPPSFADLHVVTPAAPAPIRQPQPAAWLTLAEVADHVGVTARTVRRWRTDAGLPVVRRGGVVRVHRDDLDRWLRNRTDNPGPGRTSAGDPVRRQAS